MSSPVVSAVEKVTTDWRTRLSMIMGAGLEGGLGSTFNPGDQGTSFGPFQIHLPAHPGVSAAEANNPSWAARYMLGSYQSAVARVPQSLWKSNPELAAEQAAVAAERPAQPYIQSRGQAAVDSAYKTAGASLGLTDALKHVQSGHGSSLINDLGLINPFGGAGVAGTVVGGADLATHAASGIAGEIEQAAEAVWKDVSSFLLTMSFGGVGLALIVGGLWSMTKGARQKISNGASTAAEAAAVAA